MHDQSADYIRGYKDGFGEGWDAAKQTFEKYIKDAVNQHNSPMLPVQPYRPYTLDIGCEVCGIGKNGDPLGYACQHPSCPSRGTFNRKMDDWWKQVANCDTTTTNTLSEP